MVDVEKVKAGLINLRDVCDAKSNMAIGGGKIVWAGYANKCDDALAVIEAQEKHIRELHDGIVQLRDAMKEGLKNG